MSPMCTAPWCGWLRPPRAGSCTRGFSSISPSVTRRAPFPAPSSRSPTRSSTGSTSPTTLSEHPIAERWRSLRGNAVRRAALIPYLTAGFPTPALSLEALRVVADAGADFIEVGIPFSDPLADGPTIQRSTQAALDQGMTAARVLEQIHRAALAVPVIVMTYLNPVLAFGVERFVRDAADAGVSGRLLTAVPAGAAPAMEALAAARPLGAARPLPAAPAPVGVARAQRRAAGLPFLMPRS